MAARVPGQRGGRDVGEDGFDPAMCKIVTAMCRLGAVDYDVCKLLEIDNDTFRQWQWKHPEFAHAIKVGKKDADDRVERALYNRAVGYSFASEKIMTVAQGQGVSAVERVAIVEHVPPDVSAQQFWLKNRRRDDWRDKLETEHSGTLKIEDIQRDDLDRGA